MKIIIRDWIGGKVERLMGKKQWISNFGKKNKKMMKSERRAKNRNVNEEQNNKCRTL